MPRHADTLARHADALAEHVVRATLRAARELDAATSRVVAPRPRAGAVGRDGALQTCRITLYGSPTRAGKRGRGATRTAR